MKLGNIKECFTILFAERTGDGSIDEHTIKFAQSIARKGFEWHNKDRRIYYNLFKMLMNFQNNQFAAGLDMEDDTAVQSVDIRRDDTLEVKPYTSNQNQAIKILAKNCTSIPFEKITANFDDGHVFNEDVNELYRRLFEQIDVAQRHE